MSEKKETSRPRQESFSEGGFNREDVLEEVRAHVEAAAKLLNTMGEDHSRLGWVLEDTLMYLDEIETKHVTSKTFPSIEVPLEDQVKLVKKTSK